IATDAKVKQEWVYLVIGASYNNSSSNWEWVDGSEIRYTNWEIGEPHRSDSDVYGYMRITPVADHLVHNIFLAAVGRTDRQPACGEACGDTARKGASRHSALIRSNGSAHTTRQPLSAAAQCSGGGTCPTKLTLSTTLRCGFVSSLTALA
ncbi:hypothetical protein AAVH_42627, partial [Aphelenchoides avenae]